MQCIQALGPITANVAPLDPIRDGDCGTPAPVLLKSIGAVDKVSFDPPLVLHCAMVAGLDRWLQDSVQPAAREAFSSPVSKIIGSSYACRNVYNLPDGHLSQHAFANALDVPIFVLADGRKVDLTHGWGPTQRDLIAAAKAKKPASGTTGSLAPKKANTKDATTAVMTVSTAAASAGETAASPPTPLMILASQPKPSSCVLRMMAAVKYFLQCWALRPMTRIELICIWTFKNRKTSGLQIGHTRLVLR